LGLRIDFTTPVTSVRLDAIGVATKDRAGLEVFDAGGTLLGRYTTRELAKNEVEAMQVQRPVADIAYAVASGHAGSGVRLDRLRFGPETTVRTDAQGSYAITSLPAGTYFVEAVTPSGRALAESRREVVLAEGEALGPVDLVAQAGLISWQNPERATDVTGDGNVTPLDALTVINYINAHAGDLQVPPFDVPPPYYDVDGNGFVTAADVLIVINELNGQTYSGGSSMAPGGGGAPARPAAEGEAPSISALTPPAFMTAPPGLSQADSLAMETVCHSRTPLPSHGLPISRPAHHAAGGRTPPTGLRHADRSPTLLSQLRSAREWMGLEEILSDFAADVAGAS
jgi:hypothetical protein